MGEMQVPEEALYGAQTARAVENFPVSGRGLPLSFVHALARIKQYAALTNAELGLLDAEMADAIARAAAEVVAGKWDGQFVVDVFQTGSGTSTNMNANEVIANRAAELRGGRRGDHSVHPNDHVNLGQSSNDVIPSALHMAALELLHGRLEPALAGLQRALEEKVRLFDDVLKIGRTHLQDATPVRLGQEFSGYARQVEMCRTRLAALGGELGELALGGTAVGTGLNTHPEFATRTIARLARETGLPLREAENHFEAQSARDACVQASATLRTTAVALFKIANDIRWLGSGPRCGLGELRLPSTQPGSSIMPGKVNPVMCEMLMQVCVQTVGNDAATAFAGSQGNFELHAMMPVIARNLLESVELLAAAAEVFRRRCVEGLEADCERCGEYVEKSLAMCTALAPKLGYDRAAQIAKEAYASGRTVREVAREQAGLEGDELDRLLDPRGQTGS